MVLTSTHNLCFGAKIRKIKTWFCYIKVGNEEVFKVEMLKNDLVKIVKKEVSKLI